VTKRFLFPLEGALPDPLGHDVHHHDLGAEALAEVPRQPHRQLGVRTAAHGDQDRSDLVEPALLDHGDVARRLAHHRVDGRGEDR
jgi:hypothetical protein